MYLTFCMFSLFSTVLTNTTTWLCMTQATTLHELDDIVRSTTVVFSSSCSGQEVEKHFQNLQQILTRAPEIDDNRIEEENFVVGNKFSKWRIAFRCVTQNV